MSNIFGIQNGMVLQRDVNTNTCSVIAVIEGYSNPIASIGKLELINSNTYRLTGIPTGGPYNLQIYDQRTTASFDDLWVGDVWLLGGQSNMEGYAEMRESDFLYDQSPVPQIRAFHLDNNWRIAKTRIHFQWANVNTALSRKWICENGFEHTDSQNLSEDNCGVGPGLFIAKYLFEQTGVPQGLIPCAFGGSCMDDWSPDNHTATSLYQSMLHRFKACGSNARGIFWYQGEADFGWIRSQHFTEKMIHFINSLRNDFSIPNLPFVQAQIGLSQIYDQAQLDNMIAWAKFRQQQAELHKYIPCLSTISVANTYRHDMIHLDANSQEQIGKTFAMEMLSLLGNLDQKSPTLRSITLQEMKGHLYRGQTAIVLTYDNVIGSLTSYGHPYGYSVTLFDEIPYLSPYKGIRTIKLSGNQVFIVTEYTYEQLEHAYVWYSAGCNTVSTIQDSAGRAPLAMGPVPVISKHNHCG